MEPSASKPANKRTLLLVFVIALAVKAAVLWSLRQHPLLQPAGEMDSNVYLTLAREGVPAVAYYVSPFYLYFLKAAGASIDTARIIQILLGSVAVVLQFLTAARWFGRKAAVVTAALSILTGVITFNEITILQSAVDPFLVSLMLYTLTVALQQDERNAFVLAGLSAALFTINRPNALIWLIAAAAFLLLRKKMRPAMYFAAGAAIVLTPVVLRNYVVARELVLISSHGGLNFYIGNNETADGTYQAIRGIRPTIQGQAIDAKAMAERETGHAMTSAETSRWFYQRSFIWIRDNPAAAAALLARKLVYCFHQTDLALNHSYAFFSSSDVASPLRALIAGAWIIVPVGFAGAVSRWRDRLFLSFFAFIPLYAFSVALFFVSSRYRLPLLVALTVCAAGIVHARRSAIAAIVAGIAGLLMALWPFHLDDGRSQERTNMVAWLIEHSRFEEAESLLSLYAPTHAEPARLHHRSAIAYEAVGENERASRHFAIVRNDPTAQPVLRDHSSDELVRIYVESGRLDEARSIIASIEPSRLNASRALSLGRLSLDARDSTHAVTLLRLATSGDPTSAAAWQHLGIALLAENDPDGALAVLERAQQLSPRDLDTLLFLGLAHSRTGNVEVAKRFAQEALRIDPSFAAAKRLLGELEGEQ
jgi:tetratricopeptide (TPR) repeat protein